MNFTLGPLETRHAHSHSRSVVALVGLLACSLAGNLNANIVTMAYPAMMQAYQVTFDQVVWIGVGATLGLAALLPLGGRLGDIYGYRRLFLIGTGVFLVGCCALSTAQLPFGMMVAARLLQGFGSSTVTPAVLAIIAREYPSDQRSHLVGLWALSGGLGAALGPSLGGVLVATLGWQAVFGAAVPVLALSLVLVWWCVPSDPPRSDQRLEDGAGAGLLTGAILSSGLALQQIARPGNAVQALIPLFAAIILGALFVVRERRLDHPFLPLSLFRVPGFMPIVAVAHLQMVAQAALLAVSPLYLISVRRLGPDVAGLVILPLPLALVASPAFGALAERLGARRLVLAGMTLIAVQGALAMGWGSETAIPLVAVELGMAGVGMGLVQTPLVTLATRLIPPPQLGIGTGFVSMTRFLGLVVGPSVAGLIIALVPETTSHAAGSPLAVGMMPMFMAIGLLATCGAALSRLLPQGHGAASSETTVLPRQLALKSEGSLS